MRNKWIDDQANFTNFHWSIFNSLKLDIYNITSACDMLSSCMKIDETEKDTNTATSAAVVDTNNDGVATAEELRVDVTSVGSGASGLEVRLTFTKP